MLRQIPGVSDVQMFGERAHVLMDRASQGGGIRSILQQANLTVTKAETIATSLEDVFIPRDCTSSIHPTDLSQPARTIRTTSSGATP